MIDVTGLLASTPKNLQAFEFCIIDAQQAYGRDKYHQALCRPEQPG